MTQRIGGRCFGGVGRSAGTSESLCVFNCATRRRRSRFGVENVSAIKHVGKGRDEEARALCLVDRLRFIEP